MIEKEGIMKPIAPPKILVVDDDADTVNLIRLVLQKHGYRVTTATTWEEIQARIRFEETALEPIDLVILDIMMPIHSGFDVMLVLQNVLHPVPQVIFLSAKNSMEDMVKASDMGAAKYLTKPTTPDRLVTAVESVIHKVRG